MGINGITSGGLKRTLLVGLLGLIAGHTVLNVHKGTGYSAQTTQVTSQSTTQKVDAETTTQPISQPTSQPEINFRKYEVITGGPVRSREGDLKYAEVKVSYNGNYNKSEIIGLLDLRGAEGIARNDDEGRINLMSGYLLRHLAFSGGARFDVYVMPEGQEIFMKNPKAKRLLENGVFSPMNNWIYVEKGSETERILRVGNPEHLLSKKPIERKFSAPKIQSELESMLYSPKNK